MRKQMYTRYSAWLYSYQGVLSQALHVMLRSDVIQQGKKASKTGAARGEHSDPALSRFEPQDYGCHLVSRSYRGFRGWITWQTVHCWVPFFVYIKYWVLHVMQCCTV